MTNDEFIHEAATRFLNEIQKFEKVNGILLNIDIEAEMFDKRKVILKIGEVSE